MYGTRCKSKRDKKAQVHKINHLHIKQEFEQELEQEPGILSLTPVKPVKQIEAVIRGFISRRLGDEEADAGVPSLKLFLPCRAHTDDTFDTLAIGKFGQDEIDDTGCIIMPVRKNEGRNTSSGNPTGNNRL
ncbi:hypothetical protein NDU88_001164 [Pleurodeles waltl]|uniref:Uncharacterized protein n=1 Tax=Pleurodeles waltl TaxID=8319 RepID=A0AAV7MP62_PLEWA|nr:hypothetical protein NDU88_001164 [Pleurodeles waltl]